MGDMIDWLDIKTNTLEKAWRDYIEIKDNYKKQVGFCPIQPFPAGFTAGWEAAKKAYKIQEALQDDD